jgi:hypothetical protein
VAHAAAVVRGQWTGQTIIGSQDGSTRVSIPKVFSDGNEFAPCYAFHGAEAASCATRITDPSRNVVANTSAGRYPPLYYLIVGPPSLLFRSTAGVWIMRLVSALLNSLFLGLAVATVVRWSRNRLILLGLVLGATPTVFYLAAVVNPNGLECTLAICLWCAGTTLALDHRFDPPVGLVIVTGLSAALLTLTRGISPLWVAIIFLLVALLMGDTPVRKLVSSKVGLGMTLVVTVCGGLAVAWIATQHALDLIPGGQQVVGLPGSSILRDAIGNSSVWFQQMVGVLGWLDTSLPSFTYLFWYVAVGMVAVFGIVVAKKRELVVFVLLIVVILILPVAIEFSQARRVGLVWQGRYSLPLAVGIPIIATALIDRSNVPTSFRNRFTSVIFLGVLAAQCGAFFETVRRYTVGDHGPLAFWTGQWQPPAGTIITCCWYLVAMVLTLVVLRSLVTQPDAVRNASSVAPVEVSQIV